MRRGKEQLRTEDMRRATRRALAPEKLGGHYGCLRDLQGAPAIAGTTAYPVRL